MKLERWILKHTGAVVGMLSVITVALIAVTTYVLVKEQGVERRLGPVRVVGPCRTFGPNNPECILQSNLIFTACKRHPNSTACKQFSALAHGYGAPNNGARNNH